MACAASTPSGPLSAEVEASDEEERERHGDGDHSQREETRRRRVARSSDREGCQTDAEEDKRPRAGLDRSSGREDSSRDRQARSGDDHTCQPAQRPDGPSWKGRRVDRHLLEIGTALLILESPEIREIPDRQQTRIAAGLDRPGGPSGQVPTMSLEATMGT